MTGTMALPLIRKYFPDLTEAQLTMFDALPPLYEEWNARINLISRKDIEHLEEHHLLHSLAIAKSVHFPPGSRVLDIGTGGGFPGIPLAIRFPQAHFTLIDGTGKKIRVVRAVAEAVGLSNVTPIQVRAEELTRGEGFHYIVSRGALPAPELYRLALRLIPAGGGSQPAGGATPGGLFLLKGGDLTSELKPFPRIASVANIEDFFPGLPFFQEKKVVYIPI